MDDRSSRRTPADGRKCQDDGYCGFCCSWVRFIKGSKARLIPDY
ncbi:MAG: hypothetical protein ACETWM_11670 [Candidatus Lokiarchaeia archaeon]